MTNIKINDRLYPAEINGRVSDTNWIIERVRLLLWK